MESLNNLSNNIKELCQENDINIKELAKILAIQDSLLYKYVNGVTMPTLKNLIKIANYFKCSLSFLVGLDSVNDYKNIDLKPNFINRYKLLLTKNGITNYSLCKNLNLTPSSLSNWEKGQLPYLDTLIAISQFFNVSLDYLVGLSNEE